MVSVRSTAFTFPERFPSYPFQAGSTWKARSTIFFFYSALMHESRLLSSILVWYINQSMRCHLHSEGRLQCISNTLYLLPYTLRQTAVWPFLDVIFSLAPLSRSYLSSFEFPSSMVIVENKNPCEGLRQQFDWQISGAQPELYRKSIINASCLLWALIAQQVHKISTKESF